jgi:hypothetical protein
MANETLNPPQPQPVQAPGNQPAMPAGVSATPQPVYVQASAPQPVYAAAPAPGQAVVYQQPVVVPQPVVAVSTEPPGVQAPPHIILIGHSRLFYWWPAWAVGYVMAFLTWLTGQNVQVGDNVAWFYPGKSMGVAYIITLFLVILISNITLRGLASALAITGIALLAVLFAYFDLWSGIFDWFGSLNVFINAGAYFWFSTLIFVVWAFATFVFDRMTYWRITPGQITQEKVFGASTKSFDTESMTFEKRRDDIFRHWLLGLGSGDLRIHAFSAGQRENIEIPNVLFIGSKIQAIQLLIATQAEGVSAPVGS